jgi:hypothetical protein
MVVFCVLAGCAKPAEGNYISEKSRTHLRARHNIMGGVLAMLPKYFIFREAASCYFCVQLLSEILSWLKFL